jgi:hypothetical protein
MLFLQHFLSQQAFDIGFALRLLLPSVVVNQESPSATDRICQAHHPQIVSSPPCRERPTGAFYPL